VEKIDEMFGDDFGEGRTGGMGALATSFYIVNNIQVSFFAFALGVFLGLGTAFILVYNGMFLGGVTAVIAQHGLSYNFWSFVSSHGAVELGAIVIAGAAGLRIGLSLLNPGMLRRKDALAAAARDAGLLMGGVVTLLAIAAFIEGFISPSTLPNPVKLVFGILNLLALVCYLVLAGRGSYAPGPNASR
jgi:uncharacterized membrane protein SpoIIM required for sporulation